MGFENSALNSPEMQKRRKETIEGYMEGNVNPKFDTSENPDKRLNLDELSADQASVRVKLNNLAKQVEDSPTQEKIEAQERGIENDLLGVDYYRTYVERLKEDIARKDRIVDLAAKQEAEKEILQEAEDALESIGLYLDTQELTPEEKNKIMGVKNSIESEIAFLQ